MDTLAGRTTTGVELPEALTAHLDGIRALCEQYRIRALYVFGSAVHGDFDPETSDLDFVVDSGDDDTMYERMFNFSYHLERLVARNIDLVTSRSIEHLTDDPLFRAEVDATRVMLHATIP